MSKSSLTSPKCSKYPLRAFSSTLGARPPTKIFLVRWGLTLSKVLPDGCSSFGTAFLASTWRHEFKCQRLTSFHLFRSQDTDRAAMTSETGRMTSRQIHGASQTCAEVLDVRLALWLPDICLHCCCVVGFPHLSPVYGVLQADDFVCDSRILKDHEAKASGPAGVAVVAHEGLEYSAEILKEGPAKRADVRR